ncbi:MAG: hypothetical protein MZV63_56145 [Marinilabiliales bacterium]|nr:hypothetical protein [Marinilabiliales bacterium]
MWPIINGDEPIFYIHYDGSDYEMIDGMTWQFASAMVPCRSPAITPSGTTSSPGPSRAPAAVSPRSSMSSWSSTVPVPTITGNDPVCAGSVATYTTEPGMNGYVWNIVGGTGTSATNSITVTWGSSSPDPSASTTPILTAHALPPHQRSRALSSMPCRWFLTSPCWPMWYFSVHMVMAW